MVSNIYDVDEAGNENRILYWLRLGSWHLCDAAMLFADINPESMSMGKNKTFHFSRLTDLKGLTYDGFDVEACVEIDQINQEHLAKFERKYNDIHSWLNNGDNERESPSYWIKVALAKKISIPWLNFAIEQGFYEKPKQLQEVEKPLNQRTENNYLRLIMSLANGIKGFNPQNPYEAAQLIIDETEIDLGKQTIADYIIKAYALESKSRD
jgi:hypothetical protein